MAKNATKLKEKQEAVIIQTPAEKEQEVVKTQAYLDALNADKQKRNMLNRSIGELEAYINELTVRRNKIVEDYEAKNRILSRMNDAISGATSELNNLQFRFERENKKMVDEYAQKIDQVNKTDVTLQELVRQNKENEQRLRSDRNNFILEKETNRRLVEEMKRALDQNQAQWRVREQDLLNREQKLRDELASFEDYKNSLAPELARITSIRNENFNLEQKLNAQEKSIANVKMTCERIKQEAEEQRILAEVKIKEERARLQNEDARLRQWEKDMQDQELELKAKVLSAQKMFKREKLQEEIQKAKEREQ